MNRTAKKDKMISVRVTEDEERRIKTLAANVIRKNPHLNESNVLRELLSVIDTGLITPQMRWNLSHPEQPESGIEFPMATGSAMPLDEMDEEGKKPA